MINIFELYGQFNSMYNTSQFGFFRPQTDFMFAIHELSLTFFNKMGPEAYKTQQYQDLLSPFSKTTDILVTSRTAYDIALYPKDYVYFSSSRMLRERESGKAKGEEGCEVIKDGELVLPDNLAEDFFVSPDVDYTETEIVLVTPNRWAAVTQHRTKGPSIEKGRLYARQQTDEKTRGFVLLPKGIGVMVLDYYRLPVKPLMNYTLKENGPDEEIVFIEDGSVHLEWSEAMIPVFLYWLGKRYGLTIQNQLILQVRNVNEIFE